MRHTHITKFSREYTQHTSAMEAFQRSTCDHRSSQHTASLPIKLLAAANLALPSTPSTSQSADKGWARPRDQPKCPTHICKSSTGSKHWLLQQQQWSRRIDSMLANAQQGSERFPRSRDRGRLHYHAHQALHSGKGLPVLCWLLKLASYWACTCRRPSKASDE